MLTLVVVKDEVLAAHPDLPVALYAASAAHEMTTWSSCRPSLEALVQYAAEQHVIPEIVPVESLFAAAVRDT